MVVVVRGWEVEAADCSALVLWLLWLLELLELLLLLWWGVIKEEWMGDVKGWWWYCAEGEGEWKGLRDHQ